MRTVILPRVAACLVHVADGVRRVHHEVQHDLVDLAAVTGHARNFAEVGFHVGDVAIFTARHHQRAVDRAIQIHLAHLALVGVREVFHRAHDLGDARKALGHARQRRRQFFTHVVHVFAGRGSRRGRLVQLVDVREQLAHAIANERHAVVEILDRRVDFVRHARGQAADGFEPVAGGHARLGVLAIRDVEARAHDAGEIAGFITQRNLRVRMMRSMPRVLSNASSSLSMSGTPDCIIACSSAKNFSACSRGKKSKSVLPMSS